MASGATVKPSLLFFKKFNDEEAKQYDEIKQQATTEVDAVYEEEFSQIEEKLTKRGKEALPKEVKKALKARKKQIEEQRQSEIKAKIKEQFDYEIPIAEVQKAGINTTGAKIENELEPLEKEFTPYRKEMRLWEVPVKETKYDFGNGGGMYRIRIADNIVSEPEVFYGHKK